MENKIYDLGYYSEENLIKWNKLMNEIDRIFEVAQKNLFKIWQSKNGKRYIR